ncbi:MAG: DegV family protein [Acidimicrobiales bacterium]
MLIVTDGAVDLPAPLEESPLLRIVPGAVWLKDEPFVGGVDEFWALLRRGAYPSTTPPAVDALVEAYGDTDAICAMHVSAELSSTVARAREAASLCGSDVAVIDTRSFSVGAGLITAAVHWALQNPSGPQSITDFAQSLPLRLHTFALIQNVESLRRSDRAGMIPKSHLARHHPLLLAVRGRVVPLEQCRNRGGALKRLVAHVRHSAGPEIGAWALGHGDASDHDGLADELSRAFGRPPSFIARLDPTVGAHVGPEAVVVGAISDPVDL